MFARQSFQTGAADFSPAAATGTGKFGLKILKIA
jgi:hypothetical protein